MTLLSYLAPSRGRILDLALLVSAALLVLELGFMISGGRRDTVPPVPTVQVAHRGGARRPSVSLLASHRQLRGPRERERKGRELLVRDYEFRRALPEHIHSQNQETLREAAAAADDSERSALTLSVEEAQALEARGDIIY